MSSGSGHRSGNSRQEKRKKGNKKRIELTLSLPIHSLPFPHLHLPSNPSPSLSVLSPLSSSTTSSRTNLLRRRGILQRVKWQLLPVRNVILLDKCLKLLNRKKDFRSLSRRRRYRRNGGEIERERERKRTHCKSMKK